jgi:hypothetical protein
MSTLEPTPQTPPAEALALLVRRARSLAAIAGLFLGAYLALRAGHDLTEAVGRGLGAGAASGLAVWAIMLTCVASLRRESPPPLQEAVAVERPASPPEP